MKLLKIIATVASAVLLMFILPACGGDSTEVDESHFYEVEFIDDSDEIAEENLFYFHDLSENLSLLDDEKESLEEIFYDVISPSAFSAISPVYALLGSKNECDSEMRKLCSLAEKKISSQVWSSSFIIKVKDAHSSEVIFEYVYHHKQVQYYRLSISDGSDEVFDENHYWNDNNLIDRSLSSEEGHFILNSYYNVFSSFSYNRGMDSESISFFDFEMIGEEDDCNDKIIDSCEEIEDNIGEKTWSASFNVKIEHYKSGVIRNFTHHQAK